MSLDMAGVRPARGPAAPARGGRRPQAGKHLALICIALAGLFPFYWLVVMATSTSGEVFRFPPRMIPGSRFLDNLGHSLIVALCAVVLATFLCSLGGFVFARMRFPGRGKLFGFVLATLVFPTGVSLAPTLEIYSHLGWINTFLPLIAPGAASAFGLFWMRQYALSAIPYELIEASTLDGCGLLRTYWHVALPAMRPAIASFGIFTFMWSWNDYLWPLLVLNDPEKYTVPVALAQLKGTYGNIDYSVVMAGTLVGAVLLLVLFLFVRKWIFSNMVAGAVK